MTGSGNAPSWRERRMRTLPRRGLSRREAALYCGIGARAFDQAVRTGKGPQPRLFGRGRQPVWDMADLDAWMESWPRRGQSVAIQRRVALKA